MQREALVTRMQKRPRLLGLLCIVLVLPTLYLGWVNAGTGSGRVLRLALGASVGLFFGLLFIVRGHRLPRWGTAAFLVWVALLVVLVGRRGGGVGAIPGGVGAAAAISLGVWMGSLGLALVAGLNRAPARVDED